MEKSKAEWFLFEDMTKISPQTTMSYSYYQDKDHLGEYFKKDLKMKNFPRQEVLLTIKQGNGYLYYNNHTEKLAEKIFKKTVKKPDFGIKSNKQVKKNSDQFFKIVKQMQKLKLYKLSNKKLTKVHKKYYKSKLKMHSPGWYGNLADHDGIMLQYLNNYLKRQIKKTNSDMSPEQTLQKLTETNKLSTNQKEEINILKIIDKILKSKKAKQLFQKNEPNIIAKKLEKIDKKIADMLTTLTNKYCWLTYGFAGPAMNKEDFIIKIKDIINEKIEPEKLIKEIKSKKEKTNLKKKIIKKLCINRQHKKLFKVFTDIIFLKGYRKDSMFFGCYIRDKFLKHIGEKQKISLRLMQFLLPTEIEKAIQGEINKEILQERFKYMMTLYIEGKGLFVKHGKEAKEIVKKLKFKKVKITNKNELKGMCASVGHATGTAKIINKPEDMKKMEKGDILISEATNPNLMYAIKKAAAIVTNVGGIACHAAIVSRELGKPCLIGTKVATKVFKDGDIVEVDADKGVVRKIITF